MRNVYFCSKNNQAINVFPDLCNLVSIQIKNSKEYLISNRTSILKQPDYEENNNTRVKYASYSNCNAGNEFLESICHVIEENLFEEVNNSKF